MRKLFKWGLIGLVLLAGGALMASVVVSRPLYDDVLDPASLHNLPIAPPVHALTFARAEVYGQRRVLLVTEMAAGKVIGIDLNARLRTAELDPLKIYRDVGYERLAAHAQSIANAVAVDVVALDLPFDAPEQNVGVGLNYREHAQESALDEEPFLFPKFARPTPARSDVSRGASTLLDYEAELGLVAMQDLTSGEPPRSAIGLVLANELTDRWALVRNFERGAPMGTTGFADGKSREGFAPIGPLLVVPRNLESFYSRIRLRLYVNGRLRQSESASAMLWDPRRILAETFWRADTAYRYRGRSVPLLAEPGRLAAGTIVFSGTPAGVIFKPLNLWNPWVYLRPGDEVVVVSDFLGVIRNRIVE